jgi:hypothetical protein
MAQDVKLKLGIEGLEKAEQDIKKLSETVKSLQSELNKGMKIPANAPRTGGGVGAPGAETFRETLQINRAKAQERQVDQSALNIANSALAAKNREIEKLALRQKSIVSDKKAEAEYERQINQHIKDRQRLEETQIQLRNRVGGRAGPAPSSAGGGAGGGAGGSGGGGGLGNVGGNLSTSGGLAASALVGAVTGAFASMNAVGSKFENIRKSFAESSYRAQELASQAYNMNGSAGQQISSAFAGTGSQEVMFSGEIGQARANARKEMEGRLRSPFAVFARPRQSFLGAFGSDAQKEKIRQELEVESSTETSTQLEAIKNGPDNKVRTESRNKFIKDWRRNLDFQRQTGMSEDSFRGFLGGVNHAGFTDESGMATASAILGAGGSTRSATGNSAFALQMGRQFDLTNSAQALGGISGQLGGAGQSKDALIAIQAEGTRIGLNRSEFREENRRFVEMAAGVINKSNVSSGAGVDQIMEMFTRAMTGATTVTGLEAGKSAYEAYQKQSNIQSGPSAVMRAAGMRGDKILGQLDERDRAKLSMMPESEITTDNNIIQDMAAKHGVSPGDIVKNLHAVIGKSLLINPTSDAAIAKLRAAQKKYAPGSKELAAAEGEAAGELSLEGFGAGMTNKELTQEARMLAADDYEGMAKLQKDVKNQAESGKTTRPGDEMEKQQAAFSDMANQMFTALARSITPAAEQTAIFTANINALVAAMKGGVPSEIAAAQKNLFNFNGPQDQTQVNTGGRGHATSFWHP